MKPKDGQEVVGNRGPARSGATSAWFGEFRVRNGAPGCISELSGTVSGSFRSLQRRSLGPSERPLPTAAWFGDSFGLRNSQT